MQIMNVRHVKTIKITKYFKIKILACSVRSLCQRHDKQEME